MDAVKRRITLLDVTALIAAIAMSLAVGLASLREAASDRIRYRTDRGIPISEATRMETWGLFGRKLPIPGGPRFRDLEFAVPCSLMVLSAGMLCLRLRSPRPSWQSVVRRPGTSACLAALIAFVARAVGIIAWYSVVALHLNEAFRPRLLDVFDGVGTQIGTAVAACCITLIIGRGRQLEWDWLEVLGVILGGTWIAQIFMSAFVAYVDLG